MLFHKRIYVLCLALVTFVALHATEVDSNAARRVADAFRVRLHLDARQSTLVRYTHGEGAMLYIFNYGDNDGYVVVPSDDRALPVIGYATRGKIDTADMPINMRFWIDLTLQAVRDASVSGEQADDENDLWWRELAEQHKATKSDDDAVVGPLMNTHWGQSPYYNDLCPIDRTTSRRSVTGCVATAMGQIMRYWRYPSQGRGSHSYNSTKCGQLSVDFSSASYVWSSMPYQLGTSSSTAQRNAVATLLYHCGVATDMDYSSTESGAFMGNAASALVNYFDYSPGMAMAYRSSSSDQEWMQIIVDELNIGRPILYSGTDASDGGHAFICDGYNRVSGRVYYNFNWGWNGQCDGYWTLTPSPYGTSESFVQSQEMIYHIEPSTMLHVDRTSLMMNGMQSADNIVVSSSVDDDTPWRVVNASSWLTVEPSSGAGSGVATTVTISVEPNQSGAIRYDTITIVQGRRTQQIVVMQRQLTVARTIVRYDTINVGETGYHSYLDTLFYEDFDGDNFSCWNFDAGDGCEGFDIVTTLCWRVSDRYCKDAYSGLSAFEATSGTGGYASFLKTPAITIYEPSMTTASFMLYNEAVVANDAYYYDEAALIYIDQNTTGYVIDVTATDVEFWTHMNATLRGVTAGEVVFALGHSDNGGVGMGADNLLIFGPRHVDIPSEVSSAAAGTSHTVSETTYRTGCMPTVITTHWTVRGTSRTDTLVVRDTVVVEQVRVDTVTIHDTVTTIVHDTVTVMVTDTLRLYDTICNEVLGLSPVEDIEVKIYATDRVINIECPAREMIMRLYDVQGRLLATRRNDYGISRFDVGSAGVYMVRIGDSKAYKVVVR